MQNVDYPECIRRHAVTWNCDYSVFRNSMLLCINLHWLIVHLFGCYVIIYWIFFFLLWRCDPTRVMTSSFLSFLDHTQRRITVGRTPLDKWSAHRRDLYLTTQNTHNRQTSMPPVVFEPTISAGERPQTYALDRAATGTDTEQNISFIIRKDFSFYWLVDC